MSLLSEAVAENVVPAVIYFVVLLSFNVKGASTEENLSSIMSVHWIDECYFISWKQAQDIVDSERNDKKNYLLLCVFDVSTLHSTY